MGKTLRLILALIAVVALALCVLMWIPFMSGGLQPGAPWVPEQPPLEENRVFHPDGFSLIHPPDWAIDIYEGRAKEIRWASLSFTPGSKGYRFAPGISVRVDTNAPELTGFQEIRISDVPAYERSVYYAYSKRPTVHYQLYLQRSNEWYQVRYHTEAIQENSSEIPAAILPYLRSFRFSKK